MASHFGWVDFAEDDRRRMLDIIKLFEEQETRDEIGIGTIRDAFADYFFPGTSTIQTRARYMLLIPWLYKELEQKRIPSVEVGEKARKEEINLIYSLMSSGENEGIIGVNSKEHLKRLPSNIYWIGLGSWGIRKFQGSQEQYHRSLDSFYRRKMLLMKESDQEDCFKQLENWDPGLPQPPKEYKENAKLPLSKDEAEYLRDRIICNHSNSLLAHFVKLDEFVSTDDFWMNPIMKVLPKTLVKEIELAWNFSDTFHGASLLYNLMLARACSNEDNIEYYEEKCTVWAELMKDRWKALSDWAGRLDDFWMSAPFLEARIPLRTKAFVESWVGLVFNGGALAQLKKNIRAQQLIRDREYQLKHARARLENPRALEMWNGASGTYKLNYRWNISHDLVMDILDGLQGGNENA